MPDAQCYKLVYTVLLSYLDVTKDAIFEAGGDTYAGGKYKQVNTTITSLRRRLTKPLGWHMR
jgi:hypothetical protein